MNKSKTQKIVVLVGVLIAVICVSFFRDIEQEIQNAAYRICEEKYTLTPKHDLELLNAEENRIFQSLLDKASNRRNDCFQVAAYHLKKVKSLSPRETEMNTRFENGTLEEPMNSFIKGIIDDTNEARDLDASR